MSSNSDRIRVPARLGNWVLQSNLGAGYSGERSEDFDKRVVHKLTLGQDPYGKQQTLLPNKVRQ